MLKAVELNREVTIAQYQEELHRLRTERDTHPTDAVRDGYLKNICKYNKYIFIFTTGQKFGIIEIKMEKKNR